MKGHTALRKRARNKMRTVEEREQEQEEAKQEAGYEELARDPERVAETAARDKSWRKRRAKRATQTG